MKGDTVKDLLAKSELSEFLEEIDKGEIKDLAVVYRTADGLIHSRWLGDNLALVTMSVMLAHDIENSLGESTDE